uniref:ATP synthase F0 subunit 8 n=1 Tax=Siboglinum fiordicum TaxID=27908 RepID=A0A0E3DR78_9ANNE|nr:ATP synthase F0 subunit 8 [Siboglinum fiordicum]AIL54876.1 ATP synthase F0 subunit 8 [Siboglinum fiordicum]
MPHLASLNWTFLPIIFYLCLISLMSIFWWFQLPFLPKLMTSNNISNFYWKW